MRDIIIQNTICIMQHVFFKSIKHCQVYFDELYVDMDVKS